MNLKKIWIIILPFVVYTICLIAAGLVSILIYWSLESTEVLDVKNATVTQTPKATVYDGLKVRPDIAKPDEKVFISLDYCKLKSVHGDVIARLVGEEFITRLTWPNDSSPAGCVINDVGITIPKKIDSDIYYVEFQVEYHINPQKTTTVILRSDKFKIEAN